MLIQVEQDLGQTLDWTKGWARLEYTEEEEVQITGYPTNFYLKEDRLWCTLKGETILPRRQAVDLIKQMHQWTHLGSRKLIEAVKGSPMFVMDLRNIADDIVRQCQVCQQVSASQTKQEKGKRLRGNRSGVFWEVDFTEVNPGKYGYKY